MLIPDPGKPKRTGALAAGPPRRSRPASSLAGPVFLLALFFMVRLGELPGPVLHAYLGSSLACFALYGADKWAAAQSRRRVRERTLHLAGLLGGWPGAILAQRIFHHKSRKASFRALFRLTVLANCAALALIVVDPGGWWR